MITLNETKKLLVEIHSKFGYNMMNYDLSFSQKTIIKTMKSFHKHNYEDFRAYVLGDEMFIKEMFGNFFINVSWMFRDPEVFKKIREEIIPILASYPRIKIWSAGCATGEEAYSIAILLREAGLFERSIIYATDIDEYALDRAKNGTYKLQTSLQFMENYYLSGGTGKFSDYFTIKKNEIVLDTSLSEIICFAEHDLINDTSFNEFQLILCRNLFIYFDQNLQSHAVSTFDASLERGGFFISGKYEHLEGIGIESRFQVYDKKNKIYKKVVR